MKMLEMPSVKIVNDSYFFRTRTSSDSRNFPSIDSLLVLICMLEDVVSKFLNTSSMIDCLQPLRKCVSTLAILA